MSDLWSRIQFDLQQSLKSGEKARVEAVRLIIAAVKNFEIDAYPPGSNKSLTDEDVIGVLQKLAKRHRESIEAYEKGGRSDLVDKERVQLSVVEKYLPKGLSEDEVRAIVVQVVAQEKDCGRVMGMVMGKVKGRADGNMVVTIVREMLQQ